MRRKFGLCGFVLCTILLAGCGGGTSTEWGGSTQDTLVEKTSLASELNPTLGTDFGAPGDDLTTGKGKQLGSVIRPLAKSPFALARDGLFHVFAGNGSQQRLQLSFSPNHYEFWDDQGRSTSGTFSLDLTQPGTYVFDATGTHDKTNVSRFRVTADTIVGMYPFSEFQAPQLTKARPFIGVRKLVTNPQELDGTYNRFAMALVYSDAYAQAGLWGYSVVHQLRVFGGGSTLEVCRYDRFEYQLAACPAGFKKTYALVRGGKAGFWRLSADDGSGEQLEFAIAKIGTQNVYLAAGAVQSPYDGVHDLQLRVGLPDGPGWATGIVEGPSWKSVSGNLAFPFNSVAWNSITLDVKESRHTQFSNDGQWKHALSGLYALPASPNLKMGGDLPYLGFQIIGQGAGLTVGVTRPPYNAAYPYDNGSFTLAMADAAPLMDPRSGTYEVYATNGTRHKLSLNFKEKVFRIEDAQGYGEAGAFAPDPQEEGTYVFLSARNAIGGNASRFQPIADGIVGTFPLPDSASSHIYNVRSFIAARSFVTKAIRLGGVFNRFSTTRSAEGVIDSALGATKINDAGTQLLVCNSWIVYAFDSCPSDMILTYSIIPGATSGAWIAVNPLNPSDRSDFQVARLHGKNVFLRASASLTGSYLFRIGLPATAEFGTGRAYGVDTNGSFVAGDLKQERYDSFLTRPDGSTDNLSFSLAPFGGPAGLKGGARYDIPGDKYAALQNAGLGVLLGLRQNTRTQGYMQLMVMNQALFEQFRVDISLNGNPIQSTGGGSYAAPSGSTIELTATTDVEWGVSSRCASGVCSDPVSASKRKLSLLVNSPAPATVNITARKPSTGAVSSFTVDVVPP